MQMPRPTDGYLSATKEAAPKSTKVAIDRNRIIRRTALGTPIRSTSSKIKQM